MWNTEDVMADGIGVAPRPWVPAFAGKTEVVGPGPVSGYGVTFLRRIDGGETDKYQVEYRRCHYGRYWRGPGPLGSGSSPERRGGTARQAGPALLILRRSLTRPVPAITLRRCRARAVGLQERQPLERGHGFVDRRIW